MRTIIGVALIAIAMTLGYTFWWHANPPPKGLQAFDAHVADMVVVGTDSGRGNFVGIQPWMVPSDYTNTETLSAKLDSYFAAAKAKGWFNSKTIVVLPEMIGTWLAASDEQAAVYRDAAVEPAMIKLALSHPISFARRYAAAPDVADKAKWTLFTVKSEQMARDYQAIFGSLARKYNVTLVAGSIVLPNPHLENGQLRVEPGETLRNVSALFGPDGKIIGPLVIKAYPIAEENVFLKAGKVDDIPVFDTPAGRLAVLICADSWYPPSYRRIAEEHAQLLAIPSYSTVDNTWAAPWTGYDGAPPPRDVDSTDVGKITLGHAWLKYSMGGRAGAAGITSGINVFLRGKLWDLGTDGETITFSNGAPAQASTMSGAVLVNQWF